MLHVLAWLAVVEDLHRLAVDHGLQEVDVPEAKAIYKLVEGSILLEHLLQLSLLDSLVARLPFDGVLVDVLACYS